MPTELLYDYKSMDLTPIADRAEIAKRNPHRGDMALIDEIVHLSDDKRKCIGRMAVKPDAFWAYGHIPGNPIMPGVLQLEAGAQVASYLYYSRCQRDWFAGFTRVKEATFRGMVTPGCDLLILIEEIKFSEKRFVSLMQGIVDDDIVFNAEITGMAFPKLGEVERVPVDSQGQPIS